MMKLKYIFPIMAASLFCFPAAAKPSLNDIQGCQAVLDFVDARVGAVSKYDEKDVKIIQSALRDYNKFLQDEHIAPGLLAFTGGDENKAKAFQTQIDAYKLTIVQGLEQRHPQPRIFTDQAVTINGCYSKAPMSADKTPVMKEALETMVKLAKQG